MSDVFERRFEMSRPTRYVLRSLLCLVIVALAAAALFPQMVEVFMTNPAINGLIAGAALFGTIYILGQFFRLNQNVYWIEAYVQERAGADVIRPPTMLAPMASMLRERRGRRASISAVSLRSILDSVSARLEEGREISRYFIGLLIFLGLLGTFWGLLQTVTAVADVIRSLTVGSGDINLIFEDLKRGLEAPLQGMGTAFSSSLLGLSGSLVLGFIDLQLGQAQNRFYNELEEWLSALTRLSPGGYGAEGDHNVPAYVSSLLEQSADSLANLQRTVARSEDNRAQMMGTLETLADRLGELAEHVRMNQQALLQQSSNGGGPVYLPPPQANGDGAAPGIDEATRAHIRSLDANLSQLLAETKSGRMELSREIRRDIQILTQTIAAAIETPQNS